MDVRVVVGIFILRDKSLSVLVLNRDGKTDLPHLLLDKETPEVLARDLIGSYAGVSPGWVGGRPGAMLVDSSILYIPYMAVFSGEFVKPCGCQELPVEEALTTEWYLGPLGREIFDGLFRLVGR